jgi:SCF-associated factor 1
MEGVENLGVISDLQSGGWSTTLLTAKGELYCVGTLDGLQSNQRRAPYQQKINHEPTALRYPPGMPQPKDRYDPVTAVKQFSSGRAHILALSDSGRIWSWQNMEHSGVNVRFIHHDINETGRDAGRSVVRKVVAGWNKSAALIEGTGIVVWEPLVMNPNECDVADAALVLETAVVPKTEHVEGRAETEEIVGAVENFVVLEHSIVFCTTIGKVFAAQIIWDDHSQTIGEPAEVRIPTPKACEPDASFVTDVQGSFRDFAVFTKTGAVLTSKQDVLMPILQQTHNQHHQQSIFKRIPALQNKKVISLAFGDYHFHALHSQGHITSYGYEPQSCGALGLGGRGAPEDRLRGIRTQNNQWGVGGGDGVLVPHAYTEGRRVWFEKEKRDWLTFLTSGGVDQEEAAERIRIALGSPGLTAQGEVSEWIEQEGQDWESKFEIRDDDDDLGAYFALSVSAAGWHSGALVLVNQNMVDRVEKAVERPDVALLQHSKVEAGPSTVPAAESSSTSPQTAEPSSDTPVDNNEDTSLWNRAADYGRYFLGMPPYNVSSAGNVAQGVARPERNVATAMPRANEPHPGDYGASPRPGFHYVWAGDHFPRLRLSDGTEMPGEVDFDEWRHGRPEWILEWAGVYEGGE